MSRDDITRIIDEICQRPTRIKHFSIEALPLLKELWGKIGEINGEDCLYVFEQINENCGKKLIGISGICAEKAIQTEDFLWIKLGLLCHLLEGFRWDSRENIRCLVLLDFSANSLGSKLDYFRPHFNFRCFDSGNEQIDLFLSRNRNLNQLESFGLKADKNSDGQFVFSSL
jgi:hypothetical protein